MRKQYWLREVCLLFLIVAATLTGCKKNVAAATPPILQPVARPPAPTITLRAATALIDRGQSTSLQWEARNASTVRIEPELGSLPNQGSRLVSPPGSVTYTATAIGPGGTASDNARITVRVPAAPSSAVPEPRRDAPVSMDALFRENVRTIYFDYQRADIRSDQISRLEANALWLKQHRGVKFTIEGYCDERGSEEYNLALGDRRANSVKEYLLKLGVDQSSITTISYGEERPICRETTEECLQNNRRAAFVASPTS